MILYSSPLSPYSARAKISLYYKDLSFYPVKPSSLGGMTSPAFLAVAPLGRIPVLELDDKARICESDSIVEYLEDAFSHAALRPSHALDAARARQIAGIAELYVINRILWGGPGTRASLGAMMPISVGKAPLARDDAEIEREAGAIAHALTNIERLMEDAGPFALGHAPSTADGALIPYLAFARYAADYLAIETLGRSRLLGEYLDGATKAHPVFERSLREIDEAMTTRRAEVEEKFGPAPAA